MMWSAPRVARSSSVPISVEESAPVTSEDHTRWENGEGNLEAISRRAPMLSPSDTAYPLLKAHPSAREVEEIFTPTLFELTFAEQQAREPTPCVGLLVCLKTFQR